MDTVPVRSETHSARRALVAAARAEIRRRCADRSLDLRDVAATLETSPRALQRAFADRQTDFRSEVLAVRMNRARRLLERGVSVRETAGRVGYSGPSGLVAAFKRYFGVSPSTAHPPPLDYDVEWKSREGQELHG